MPSKMSSTCRVYVLLLLLLLTSIACKTTTETDFRFISSQDQLSFDRFFEPGVISYSQLLFDVGGNQLLVGARDALYRLRVHNLKLLEKAVWTAPENKTSLCLVKGQSEQNCHNYIKVLLSHGKKLFVCGTNAFSPQCSWREIENLSEVTEWVDGIAKCPYNPHANITAMISQSGDFYVGGPTDFSGSDAAIYRSHLSPGSNLNYDKRHVLRTNQYNSKWLNEPHFVGSFETDKFVYFVFREAAVEYINCGKIIYSRIARVCKSDSGGQVMLKDNWTTFLKARLNCSINSDYPFYFNEIQGMSYIEGENLMYATFSTPANGIAGSAICAFNMSAINAAFLGPFKHQEHPGSTWEQHFSPHQRHFECKTDSSRSNHLVDSSRYQLMNNAVQSTSLNPLHVAELERFTHITIDVLSTKLHTSVHVMYVATSSGLVKKITVLPRTQETCVVEVWNPLPFDAPGSIKTIRYLKNTNSVYIGSDYLLLRIDAQHCSRHVSRSSCINAMDPYCGWNELQEKCTPAPDGDPLVRYWTQSVTSCPVLDSPVDGGWSNWSEWFPCDQKNTSDIDSLSVERDQCLCQTRQCNNPAPQNGGRTCKGVSITVTNCTVHGGWTPWSAWSACTQTCGTAVKTRRRTCANPAPAHGGRVCVGQDYSEIYCTNSPPCPVPQPPPRDGQWSPWSSWDECSATCGGGYRIRRRRCDNPSPQGGGQDCQGSHIDYELCNTEPCPEYKKMSPWSAWIVSSNGTSLKDGYIEKRFRCACRAHVSDVSMIKVTIAKEEERFCRNDGSCNRRDHEDLEHKWSDWSSWSECSSPCGGGFQFRTRQCEGRNDECVGTSYMSRSCNTHRCKGEWSCWTEWSQCSVTCGIGVKHRKRTCLSTKNKEMLATNCEGISFQEEPCEMPSCTSLLGWEKWTAWSLCDENNEQHRKRKCRTSNPGPHLCQGESIETRMCISDQSNDISVNGLGMQVDKNIHVASISTGVVLAYCFAGFIVGLAFACFLFFFYMRRKKPRLPSSPHYIPSKQNPYITVPLQEVPSKRHTYGSPSCSNNGSIIHNSNNSTGTLKLYSKSIADYETATIKRNSHTLNNGHNRNDLDILDKYY